MQGYVNTNSYNDHEKKDSITTDTFCIKIKSKISLLQGVKMFSKIKELLHSHNLIIAGSLIAIFMSKLDDYIVSISLPTIARDFNASTSEVSRITIIYLLVLTASLLIFGKLGDRLGLKRVFIAGLIIFTTGSFLCGAAVTLNYLILFRVIQALGAAILFVLSQAMITYYVAPEKRGVAYGLLTTFGALGMAIGPSLGGYITQYLNWHWIFFINVPVGIIAVMLSYIVIPGKTEITENKKINKEKFDIIGSILAFVSLGSLVFFMNMGQELGWTSPIIISAIIITIISFIAFIIRETICQYALLDVKLFKNINFTLANLSGCIGFVLIAGNLFLMPFYLIIAKGLTSSRAGLVMMIYPLAFLITSLISPRLINKYSSKVLCQSGLLITLCGWLLFYYTLELKGFIFVFLYLILMGIGLGTFFAPNTKMVMDYADPEKAGIASAVYRTLNNFGVVTGVCLFETIYSQFIPHTFHLKNSTIESFKAIPDVHLTGFHYAYLIGTSLCFIALIFSIIAKEKSKTQQGGTIDLQTFELLPAKKLHS